MILIFRLRYLEVRIVQNKLNLSKRDSYLLVGIVVLLVLFLYYKFLLSPVLSDLGNANAEIKSVKNELKTMKELADNNQQIQKKLDDKQAKYNDICKGLPEYEEDPDIAYKTKSIADKNGGIVLQSISISKPVGYISSAQQNANSNTSSKTLMMVPVSLNVNAESYFKIMDFVKAIETQDRYATINTLNLSYGSSAQNPVTASITFNSYYAAFDKASEELKYDFLTGKYGKKDLFK